MPCSKGGCDLETDKGVRWEQRVTEGGVVNKLDNKESLQTSQLSQDVLRYNGAKC